MSDDQSAEAPITEDQPVEGTPSDGGLENLLSGITREDGTQKFTDVESALQSITPAQEHIKRLEAENAELKKKVDGTADVNQVVEELRQEIAQSKSGTENSGNPDISHLIDERLQAREVAKVQENNIATVLESFTREYGQDAKDAFEKVAEENGVNAGFLTDMAKRSPQAVLKLAGIAKSEPKPVAKTSGSVNMDVFEAPAKESTPHKSIMGGSTTKDLLQAWKRAGEKVTNQ